MKFHFGPQHALINRLRAREIPMSNIDDKASEVEAYNLADVMKNGPRLSHDRKIATIAKCPTGKHILQGGLGSTGIGRMWSTASYKDRTDSLWATLPVAECHISKEGFMPHDPCASPDTSNNS